MSRDRVRSQTSPRNTLEHDGTPHVETVMVMAKHNPFFEKAGIHRTAEIPQAKSALKIVNVLKTLSFDITFLRSTKYVLKKLASLKSQQLNMIKTVFEENNLRRFMKDFSSLDPYGQSKFYKRAVENTNIGKASGGIACRTSNPQSIIFFSLFFASLIRAMGVEYKGCIHKLQGGVFCRPLQNVVQLLYLSSS